MIVEQAELGKDRCKQAAQRTDDVHINDWLDMYQKNISDVHSPPDHSPELGVQPVGTRVWTTMNSHFSSIAAGIF